MVNLQVAFEGGGTGQDRRVSIGTATNDSPTNEGAQNRQRSSDSFDSISVSTINKYAQGDRIAGFANNNGTNDTLGSGAESIRSFMEVAFLGGL